MIKFLALGLMLVYNSFYDHNSKVNVIMSKGLHLKPVCAEVLTKISGIGGLAVINGGFFNLKTGESSGCICIDKKWLKETQLCRSEIRVLEKDGKESYQITTHKMPVLNGYTLIHALGGGPQLLPALTLIQERFVRGGKESICSSGYVSRTAIGIKKDGSLVLVVVDGPEKGTLSKGVTIWGLVDIMKKLDCMSAINMDGGHSSGMIYNGKVISISNPERRVKTALVIEE